MYARTFFRHFSTPDHNGFLNDASVTFIDKTDLSDPLKRENVWRETLMTMPSYGPNVEDSVRVLPFDNIKSWHVLFCLHIALYRLLRRLIFPDWSYGR